MPDAFKVLQTILKSEATKEIVAFAKGDAKNTRRLRMLYAAVVGNQEALDEALSEADVLKALVEHLQPRPPSPLTPD